MLLVATACGDSDGSGGSNSGGASTGGSGTGPSGGSNAGGSNAGGSGGTGGGTAGTPIVPTVTSSGCWTISSFALEFTRTADLVLDDAGRAGIAVAAEGGVRWIRETANGFERFDVDSFEGHEPDFVVAAQGPSSAVVLYEAPLEEGVRLATQEAGGWAVNVLSPPDGVHVADADLAATASGVTALLHPRGTVLSWSGSASFSGGAPVGDVAWDPGVALGPNGAVHGVYESNGALLHSADLSSEPFTPIVASGGAYPSVAVGADSTVFVAHATSGFAFPVVMTDNASGTFTTNEVDPLADVSSTRTAVAPDGTPYILPDAALLYRRENAEWTSEVIPVEGGAFGREIVIDASGVIHVVLVTNQAVHLAVCAP